MGLNRDDDFDASSYVSVNERLQEFWNKYEHGRIETSAFVNSDGVVVMTAKLYREAKDEHPFATGHSFLESLSGEKVGEYTETVAVGRALALAGFKVEKSIASKEEMTRWDKNKKAKEKVKEETVKVETTESEPEAKTNGSTPPPTKLRTTSRFSASRFTKGSQQ